MGKKQNDPLWELARVERAALAEDLSGLGAEQWRHHTLCGQWDVEQVVAHLTAAASLGQWRWLRSMLGARLRPDVHNERRLAEHRGTTSAETLERFRAVVDSVTAPSGHTAAYLGEIVVHAQDIRRPLGLRRTPSVEALTPVAEFYARRDFAVNSHRTVAGLELRADDGPFATGPSSVQFPVTGSLVTGSLVTGSTLALVMSMAGRTAYLDELDGPGTTVLRSRLTPTH
ncbi:maleylpyruvate isomerase family mycothiol-dependent enzyme [Nocardioides pacificus]